jgi:hypothetical protein
MILHTKHITGTNNSLADNAGQYHHVTVHFKLGMTTLDLLKYVTQECEKGTAHGDGKQA